MFCGKITRINKLFRVIDYITRPGLIQEKLAAGERPIIAENKNCQTTNFSKDVAKSLIIFDQHYFA